MEVDGGFPVGTPYTMNSYDSNQQNSQGQSRSWTATGRSAAVESKLSEQPEVTTTSACFNCGDPTHWRRDCPVRGNDRRRRTSQQGQVVVISNLEQTAEIFVRTEIFERNIMAILDTGCEMSIIITILMDSTPLEETNLKLYAANGTDIALLETVKIPIVIEGYITMVKVVVSDVIDELILGVVWIGLPHKVACGISRKPP
jgi:predicted aspartyl protease